MITSRRRIAMGYWYCKPTSFLAAVLPLMMIFFVVPASSQKVNVSVYYEALNPPSAYFIVQNLSSVFENRLIDGIHLRMVPWGDARFNPVNNTVVCQNGPEECLWNKMQACAISVFKDPNTHYGFISCIEFLAIEKRLDQWDTSCFDQLGLPQQPVLNCYNSGNGTKLAMAYGIETGSLTPPHKSLPWLLVNEEPLEHDYGNFMSYICNAYKGNVKPDACTRRPSKVLFN